jgi:endonuclease/exonuclease/phosphatase family metal-dependent hydrolase
VDLAKGGELTVVNVHGTSGIAQDDQDCRAKQFALVFEDLGNGEPAANGARNVILGDFNTDPGRNADFDESAQLVLSHVGPDKPLHFITDVGPDITPTYGGFFNIDHVISDAFTGSCWTAGVSEGHPPVTETVFFDHKPAVCTLK